MQLLSWYVKYIHNYAHKKEITVWYLQATHLLLLKQDTYSVEAVKWYIFSDLLSNLSQPINLFLNCLLVVIATNDNHTLRHGDLNVMQQLLKASDQ